MRKQKNLASMQSWTTCIHYIVQPFIYSFIHVLLTADLHEYFISSSVPRSVVPRCMHACILCRGSSSYRRKKKERKKKKKSNLETWQPCRFKQPRDSMIGRAQHGCPADRSSGQYPFRRAGSGRVVVVSVIQLSGTPICARVPHDGCMHRMPVTCLHYNTTRTLLPQSKP